MSDHRPSERVDPGSVDRRILEAAEARFIAVGRDAVKVVDVARDAEVSIGAVYSRFGSKAGLFAAVREDIHLELLEFMMSPVRSARTATWAHLVNASRRWERVFETDPKRMRIIGQLDFNAVHDEHVTAIDERIRTRVVQAVADAGERLDELVQRGEVRPCEPYSTMSWIYSTIMGTALQLLQAPSDSLAAQLAPAAYARQRMMLAQALLPLDRLNPDGTAPPEYWENVGRATG